MANRDCKNRCTCTYIHSYIHTYVHTYNIQLYIHMYIHTYMHTYIHKHIFIYILHTHTYTYTYIQTDRQTNRFIRKWYIYKLIQTSRSQDGRIYNIRSISSSYNKYILFRTHSVHFCKDLINNTICSTT